MTLKTKKTLLFFLKRHLCLAATTMKHRTSRVPTRITAVFTASSKKKTKSMLVLSVNDFITLNLSLLAEYGLLKKSYNMILA